MKNCPGGARLPKLNAGVYGTILGKDGKLNRSTKGAWDTNDWCINGYAPNQKHHMGVTYKLSRKFPNLQYLDFGILVTHSHISCFPISWLNFLF